MLFLFILSNTIFAGVYIEPAVGFVSGSGETKFSSDVNYESSYSGMELGIRGGYKFDIIYVGASYTYANFIMDSKLNEAYSSDSLSETSLSFLVGSRFSILDVWLGYMFNNEKSGKDQDSSSRFMDHQNVLTDS